MRDIKEWSRSPRPFSSQYNQYHDGEVTLPEIGSINQSKTYTLSEVEDEVGET